jgi:riboflavin biosynthesis pyrimidine reductase
VDAETQRFDLTDVLEDLRSNGIEKIMVEGGSSVIGQFLNNKAYDRFTVYVGPMIVGGGPGIVSSDDLEKIPLEIGIINISALGKGILLELGN